MRIEPYETHQLDAVIRLSLRAWTPVFDSIQKVMDFDHLPRILSRLAYEPAKGCRECLRCRGHKYMGCYLKEDRA
ncbi:hypothetical protein [Nostoc sp.]|uniref:hypothetical protein n=1 Tax=Nostoc sp. TaxID=1180 RepID=UPI002FF77BC4